MHLYLVRHGQAKSKEEDPDRSLTKQGRAEIRKVAEFIKPLHLHVQAVWHSGKTRAAETAEILAPALTVAQDVLQHPGLKPDDPVKPIARELAKLEEDVIVVGHMPHLAYLAGSLLLGGNESDLLLFPTGGTVALERTREGWLVAWMVRPDILPESAP